MEAAITWRTACVSLMRSPGLLATNGPRPASQHGRSMHCSTGWPALEDRRPSTLPSWQLAALKCCITGLPAHNGGRPASQHGRSMRCATRASHCPLRDSCLGAALPWRTGCVPLMRSPGLPATKGRRLASRRGRSMLCSAGWPALDAPRPSTLPCWQLAALTCCNPGQPAHNGRGPASHWLALSLQGGLAPPSPQSAGV